VLKTKLQPASAAVYKTSIVPLDIRPGYAQIEAASHLRHDSGAWTVFMQDVMRMPLSMLPSVQYGVKARWWKNANDPLRSLTDSAERFAIRHARKQDLATATLHS
jgi:hypothetical protein